MPKYYSLICGGSTGIPMNSYKPTFYIFKESKQQDSCGKCAKFRTLYKCLFRYNEKESLAPAQVYSLCKKCLDNWEPKSIIAKSDKEAIEKYKSTIIAAVL